MPKQQEPAALRLSITFATASAKIPSTAQSNHRTGAYTDSARQTSIIVQKLTYDYEKAGIVVDFSLFLFYPAPSLPLFMRTVSLSFLYYSISFLFLPVLGPSLPTPMSHPRLNYKPSNPHSHPQPCSPYSLCSTPRAHSPSSSSVVRAVQHPSSSSCLDAAQLLLRGAHGPTFRQHQFLERGILPEGIDGV